jgi:hypothetical protein
MLKSSKNTDRVAGDITLLLADINNPEALRANATITAHS